MTVQELPVPGQDETGNDPVDPARAELLAWWSQPHRAWRPADADKERP